MDLKKVEKWIAKIEDTPKCAEKIALLFAVLIGITALKFGPEHVLVIRLEILFATGICFAIIFIVNPTEKRKNFMNVRGMVLCSAVCFPLFLETILPMDSRYDMFFALFVGSIFLALLFRASHGLVLYTVKASVSVYKIGSNWWKGTRFWH